MRTRLPPRSFIGDTNFRELVKERSYAGWTLDKRATGCTHVKQREHSSMTRGGKILIRRIVDDSRCHSINCLGKRTLNRITLEYDCSSPGFGF